jgi:hypothetical protein
MRSRRALTEGDLVGHHHVAVERDTEGHALLALAGPAIGDGDLDGARRQFDGGDFHPLDERTGQFVQFRAARDATVLVPVELLEMERRPLRVEAIVDQSDQLDLAWLGPVEVGVEAREPSAVTARHTPLDEQLGSMVRRPHRPAQTTGSQHRHSRSVCRHASPPRVARRGIEAARDRHAVVVLKLPRIDRLCVDVTEKGEIPHAVERVDTP